MSKIVGHPRGKAKDNPASEHQANAGPGRPRLDIDAGLVSSLAGIGCTVAEIATCLSVSKDTLERNFAADIEKGREKARMSLRRKQWDAAMNGCKKGEKANATMLIWLGKQLLGQRDKQEITGPDGGPVQHEHFDLSKLSTDQLAELEKLVESAAIGASEAGERGAAQP